MRLLAWCWPWIVLMWFVAECYAGAGPIAAQGRLSLTGRPQQRGWYALALACSDKPRSCARDLACGSQVALAFPDVAKKTATQVKTVREHVKRLYLRLDAPRIVDSALAATGLAGCFATMAWLEAKYGVKLFVSSLLSSGVTFFSPVCHRHFRVSSE